MADWLMIDAETRSREDLRKVGTWNYFHGKDTDVLCLGISHNGQEPYLWKPGEPIPPPLHDCVLEGHEVWAHNVFFERCMWDLLQRKYGFPEIAPTQWRCSMALCSVFGLPRKLSTAAKALDLPQKKHALGDKLIIKLCKPRKSGEWWGKPTDERYQAALPSVQSVMALEADPELDEVASALREEQPETFPNKTLARLACDYAAMDEYALQDVRTQCALRENLPSWPTSELHVWQLDQEMNLRGVPVDLALARRCKEVAAEQEDTLNERLRGLTEDEVSSGKAVGAFQRWLGDQGCPIENMQAATVKATLLLPDLTAEVREALEIRQAIGRASVKKFQAIIERTCPVTHRLYETLAYYGAHTGRWAGRGVQLQNLPQGRGIDPEWMESLIDVLCA